MHILYKKLYETPLACIERFRVEQNIPKNIPMTYAGRLDPMAEGLLICLSGEECKQKENYLSLTKEYEFEILVGFKTDTHDLLGLVEKTDPSVSISEEEIIKTLEGYRGTFLQTYPAFSSKPINGVPRFVHAKAGRKKEEKHKVSLFDFSFKEERIITSNELLLKIKNSVDTVQGHFRQKKIFDSWAEHILLQREFKVLKFKITVSSGFYVRQLVSDIGEKLKIPMTTFWIKRTKIGEYLQPLN